MNTDTGRVRQLKEGEKLKSHEILVNAPNPDCPVCKGKGSVLIDVSKLPSYGNRAARRRAKRTGMNIKYIPCPECNPKVKR